MSKTPEDRFIDDMGLHFEASGGTRMMGRLLGWLLICDPPHQSSQQLIDRLQTTSGTISTNTRTLMMMGLLEKVHVSGERANYFQIAEDAWQRVIGEHMRHMQAVQELAAQGMEQLGETHDLARLRGLHHVYGRFLEHMQHALDEDS
jgi:DNA-binding transcriptional regulator GbsR (MarR family)